VVETGVDPVTSRFSGAPGPLLEMAQKQRAKLNILFRRHF